jgi:2-polyprenyl-3-methyl-5-hydroxy-6-metoxy-1,4-benzoquinol methylase
MRRLLILKLQSAEDGHSEEFRDLLSCVIGQARRVFDTVDVVIGPSDATDLPDSDSVLALGRANVFFTSASLERMRHALDEGTPIAVPIRLADAAVRADAPLYTRRRYELLEERILAEWRPPREPASSHLPVSLLSRTFFRDLVRRSPVSAVLTNPRLLAELGFDQQVAQAGIFHEFIDYYGELRSDILDFLPPVAQEVLEIGCGRGLTGKLIQDRLGCRVTGVEMNPEVAEAARPNLWRVLTGDVQSMAIPGRYDVVVATELFEHLNDPEAFLDKMKSLLKPGGRIVLSVPNVGHYSIVEDLLAGRWDYVPIGLLCFTHVRFLTRATLEDWIRRVGFAAHRIVPQTTELPERFRSLPASFAVDLDSLRTKGFYVILDV